MPVRWLSSSVLRWPDAQTVDQAVREWAGRAVRQRPEVLRIGYFGSYARGDWGVGSDLDMVVVVERSGQPFVRRGVEWDATDLPVPVDLLVYTRAEWGRMEREGRLARAPWRETVWVYVR
ncbi:MAG: nucleotidyltransferase domain-containing protein [Planctomycetes bacterium]|nr:nucleotidyltransferase domain-containing protein [Planctomycetota bacterium]